VLSLSNNMKFLTCFFLSFLSLACFGDDGYLARSNGIVVIGPGGSGGGGGSGTVSNAASLVSGQIVVGQGAGGVATTLDANAANKQITNVSYIYIGSNAPTDADSAFLGGGIKITHAGGVDSHVDIIVSGGTNYIQEMFRQQTNGAGVVVEKATIGLSDNILNPPNAFFMSSMTPFVWVNNTSPYPHAVLMQLNAVTAQLQVGGNIVITNTANQFYGNGGGLSNITASATNSLGFLTFATNAGAVSAFDLPVVSATAGTVESYSFQIAGTNAMSIIANSDGTTATNPIVAFIAPVVIYTNSLSSWPKAPATVGASAIVSSNGFPFILLSTNGAAGSATWTGTNKLGW
jgi:hypothetical protein